MKNWPITASIIAVLAVITMIGLGIWQLQRKVEKEAEIILLQSNFTKSPVTYPELGPVADDVLFRTSSVTCITVTNWRAISGSDAKGKAGYQYLADCQTGAEGPGALILAGVSDRPETKVNWTGGPVTGIITREPDHRTLIAKLFGPDIILRPMLVSGQGLGGLRAPKAPSIDSIPNDHLLYAIQWFIFAFAAAVIFIVAVRQKLKSSNRTD
ncbi:SURF1 family protein [Sphingorhabdus arenilitoris]|uniref:SURF1-like protein n=1 Tax=Sphingorhabdus arenilitoris TaxID=1490041 RepID=A0ABV8RDM7_9SPHN